MQNNQLESSTKRKNPEADNPLDAEINPEVKKLRVDEQAGLSRLNTEGDDITSDQEPIPPVGTSK